MVQEKIYKQHPFGIIVVVISLGIILLLDVLEKGWNGVNWLGLVVVGTMAILAFVRIKYFGNLVVRGENLNYWNWFFQRKNLNIQEISQVDWSGVWFRALRIKINRPDKFRETRIATGTMTKKDIKILIEDLMKQNPRIQPTQKVVKYFHVQQVNF